jgi:hypothetical protein
MKKMLGGRLREIYFDRHMKIRVKGIHMTTCKQCGNNKGRYKFGWGVLFNVMAQNSARPREGVSFPDGIFSAIGLNQPPLCGDKCKKEYYSDKPIRKKIHFYWSLMWWLSIPLFFVIVLLLGSVSSTVHH